MGHHKKVQVFMSGMETTIRQSNMKHANVSKTRLTLPLVFPLGFRQGINITNGKCSIFCQVLDFILQLIILGRYVYLIRINTEYIICVAGDCINDSIPCKCSTLIFIFFSTDSSKCGCYVAICINSRELVVCVSTHTHTHIPWLVGEYPP